MKGFVYLLEVVIAGVLVALTIGVLTSAQLVKTNWQRSDLIATGENILNLLSINETWKEVLAYNTSVIDSTIPKNIKYAVKLNNIPPSNIVVGCDCDNTQLSRAKSLLTPVWINGRWINFTVEGITDFSISTIQKYPLLLFLDKNDFDTNTTIQSYLAGGGGIVAVVDITDAGVLDKLNDTFNLSAGSTTSATEINFTQYSQIAKYFFGFAMTVDTPNSAGNWILRGNSYSVNNTGTYVNITGVANNIVEGGNFSLGNYVFKVKKIWGKSNVTFQPFNTSFVFNNFADSQPVRGNNIVGDDNNFAAVVQNRTAVWISNFSSGDDYRALTQAAVASAINSWWVTEPPSLKDLEKDRVEISMPIAGCCDVAETGELTLVLWYGY